MAEWEKVMYKRDSNRKAPHNAYTTGEGIVAGIAYKGYENAACCRLFRALYNLDRQTTISSYSCRGDHRRQ